MLRSALFPKVTAGDPQPLVDEARRLVKQRLARPRQVEALRHEIRSTTRASISAKVLAGFVGQSALRTRYCVYGLTLSGTQLHVTWGGDGAGRRNESCWSCKWESRTGLHAAAEDLLSPESGWGTHRALLLCGPAVGETGSRGC